MDTLNRRAEEYHDALPRHVRVLLGKLGISEIVIRLRKLGFDGEFVTVPVLAKDGKVLFFEHWSLEYAEGHVRACQMMSSSETALYGAERISGEEPYVVVTEGVMEALVLGDQQFIAVSATGDGRTWTPDMTALLETVGQVYICFRWGKENLKAAITVARHITDAKIVFLPMEVGKHGGVIDFFTRLRRSRVDFLGLLSNAVDVVKDSAA